MDNQVVRATHEWEETLGHQVRELRQSQLLTQRELARRANVSLSSLQSLEAGRGSNVTTLVRIVRSLDRSAWLERLGPSAPAISPMQELRRAQQIEKDKVKRVRHRTTS